MLKRVFSVLMVACILLAFCACGAEQGAQSSSGTQDETDLKEGQILVGYARADITPEESVPMSGYGNSLQRMSEGFRDYLYLTCMLLTDKDGNTVALFAVDVGGSGGAFFRTLRQETASYLGVPLENVIYSASHTHESIDHSADHPSVTRWCSMVTEAMYELVDKAKADQAPATLSITSVQTERMTFVRRYELEGGIFVGYESDITESGLEVVGHESEADGEMQLLKFDRAEDKTDILLANFQSHPHLGGGSANRQLSPDFLGPFRDDVNEKLGYDVMYITGAAGNLNTYSYIKGEQLTDDYREYGSMLAKYAVGAEGTYTEVDAGTIRVASLTFDGEVDHSLDYMVSVAQEALAYYKKTNSISEVRKVYHSQGINSPNHANMIINRSSKQEWPFDIWAISIGDVAFTVSPYEMFDTQGMFIKENSPYAMTIITTCANGANGYLPSLIACEHGGYEADNTYYVPGSAEKLADMYIEMLNGLHSGN